MLSIRDIQKIDVQKICLAYERWPTLARESYEEKNEQLDLKNIDHFVFAGMGGSSIPGEIISDWLIDVSDIPIHVIKGFHLPKHVGKNSLLLALSLSGDTEETLSIVDEAIRRGVTIGTLSSGGMLETISEKQGIPFTKVPKVLVPRVSFPFLLYPCARILHESNLLKNNWKEVLNSIIELEKTSRMIMSETSLDNNPAKKIALEIFKKIPLIYGSPLNRSVAIRFKDSLNENAKIHAVTDTLPELCHNEVMGFEEENRGMKHPILLRHHGESVETTIRFEILKNIIESNGYEVNEVWGNGNDRLSKIISTLYILDYVSIYVAVLRGVDPTPTHSIDQLKKDLVSKRNNI